MTGVKKYFVLVLLVRSDINNVLSTFLHFFLTDRPAIERDGVGWLDPRGNALMLHISLISSLITYIDVECDEILCINM